MLYHSCHLNKKWPLRNSTVSKKNNHFWGLFVVHLFITIVIPHFKAFRILVLLFAWLYIVSLLVEDASLSGENERINELIEFIRKNKFRTLEYDDKLVRKIIQSVTVYEEHFVISFKSGIELEVWDSFHNFYIEHIILLCYSINWYKQRCRRNRNYDSLNAFKISWQ